MSKNKKKRSRPPSVSAALPKKSPAASPLSDFLSSNKFYLPLLGLIVLYVTMVRWRFVGMPLERDEGEYAYIGGQILKGITPYQEAYSMKLPGMYYIYALMMASFGESYRGIHIGFALMNAGTLILLFFSFKKFFNPMTGILTAGFYGLMAMSLNVLGFAAHATHFAVFFVSLGLLFLSKGLQDTPDGRVVRLKAPPSGKDLGWAFLTGVMLGSAFLMKQQAVYFILFGGCVFLIFRLLEQRGNPRAVIVSTSVFSMAVFIPYLLVLVIMFATGTFGKFWFWTVQYASKYASGLGWEQGKEMLRLTFLPIWEESKWIWLLAIVGVAVVALARFSVKQKVLAISFAVFSCLATTPGFYFRPHYFVVALPAVALLAGITLEYAGRCVAEKLGMKLVGVALPLVALLFLFTNTLAKAKGYYSADSPIMLCKAVYGVNPFTESIDIANYIKANSSVTDEIAVLGSEPQIAFYADRKSATGHIYMYGLKGSDEYNVKIQEDVIAEIEKAKPLFLIFCNVSFSWISNSKFPVGIFEWYRKYAVENYDVVGLVDIPDRGLSKIYWGVDAQRDPQNQNSVWVFKRKK